MAIKMTSKAILDRMEEGVWITTFALRARTGYPKNAQKLAEAVARGTVVKRLLPDKCRIKGELYEFCKLPPVIISEDRRAGSAVIGVVQCRDCCNPLPRPNGKLGRYCAKCTYRRKKERQTSAQKEYM